MIVIAVGLRSRGQQAFGLLQMAACLPQQRGQLAVDPLRFLQFVQKRADRLSPPGILAQIANVLPPIRPPAQLVVRATLLPVFAGDKTLSRQRLHIRRRQTQAGQPVAIGRARLFPCRFVHHLLPLAEIPDQVSQTPSQRQILGERLGRERLAFARQGALELARLQGEQERTQVVQQVTDSRQFHADIADDGIAAGQSPGLHGLDQLLAGPSVVNVPGLTAWSDSAPDAGLIAQLGQQVRLAPPRTPGGLRVAWVAVPPGGSRVAISSRVVGAVQEQHLDGASVAQGQPEAKILQVSVPRRQVTDAGQRYLQILCGPGSGV